jgi:hypothetical protein
VKCQPCILSALTKASCYIQQVTSTDCDGRLARSSAKVSSRTKRLPEREAEHGGNAKGIPVTKHKKSLKFHQQKMEIDNVRMSMRDRNVKSANEEVRLQVQQVGSQKVPRFRVSKRNTSLASGFANDWARCFSVIRT